MVKDKKINVEQVLIVLASWFAVLSGFYWLLGLAGLTDMIGDVGTVIISAILSFLIIIAVYIFQHNKQIGTMEEGFKKLEAKVNRMNKKGLLNPWILFIIIAIIVLYLLVKAGVIGTP